MYTRGYTLGEDEASDYPDTGESGETYDVEASSVRFSGRKTKNHIIENLPDIEEPSDAVAEQD